MPERVGVMSGLTVANEEDGLRGRPFAGAGLDEETIHVVVRAAARGVGVGVVGVGRAVGGVEMRGLARVLWLVWMLGLVQVLDVVVILMGVVVVKCVVRVMAVVGVLSGVTDVAWG